MYIKTTLFSITHPKANAGEGVKEETLDTADKSIHNTATIVTSRKVCQKH